VAVIVMAAIPLTAVGKVFKPQLRWIAAQRVYAETVAPLARQGIEVIVSVASHEKHGSLATFAISDVTESAREEIVSKVRELMNPYAQQWEIVWK
jgi:fatty-acyl-CoA synthase